MKPSETLAKARELLQDESRWTKGAYARTVEGKIVHNDKLKAVCWCMRGAIFECRPPRVDCYDITREEYYLQRVVRKGVVAFNDDPSTTHTAVLDALDKAIQLAKENDE